MARAMGAASSSRDAAFVAAATRAGDMATPASRASAVAPTMPYDDFARALRASSSRDATTANAEDDAQRAAASKSRLARARGLADDAEAYGAYVSLMRSGLWRDVAPRRANGAAEGAAVLLCEPLDPPRERRAGEPRPTRRRTIAVPFAVSRGCFTPALLDEVTRMGRRDAEPWPWAASDGNADADASRRAPKPVDIERGDADEYPKLLVMIDSDGTTTTVRATSGFMRPADVPEKTGDGDDSDADADGFDDRPSSAPALASNARASATSSAKPPSYSDGDSDSEPMLEDELAPTLAERHARPDPDVHVA